MADFTNGRAWKRVIRGVPISAKTAMDVKAGAARSVPLPFTADITVKVVRVTAGPAIFITRAGFVVSEGGQ